MDNPVIIKGNKSGVVLILSDTEDYNLILDELDKKLAALTSHYNKQKVFALTIEGRELNNGELDKIITVFKKNGLDISDVIDSLDHSCNEQETSVNDEFSKNTSENEDGIFYRGTLRNGQVLRVRKSIVIIGDVLSGSTVVSGGSITVIGRLEGFAYAGANHGRDFVISALSMKPEKLRIYDIVRKMNRTTGLTAKEKTDGMAVYSFTVPSVAYTEDGNMFMRRI